MEANQPQANPPKCKRFTTDRFLLGLLIVECLLWLSHSFRWLPKGWAVLIAVAALGVAAVLMLFSYAASRISRRRFQFSVRSLFVLALAVAIPCGWLGTQIERNRKEREATDAVLKAHGSVGYDIEALSFVPKAPFSSFFGEVVSVHFMGAPSDLGRIAVTDADLANLKEFPRLKDVQIIEARGFSDAGLAGLIKVLPKLRMLYLAGINVSDAGLEHIEELTHLQVLSLRRTNITDAGLEHLKELTELEGLDLGNDQVGDVGLGYLKRLTKLKSLSLDGTNITDAGLVSLKGLIQLRSLILNYTNNVTDAGVDVLEKRLPNCQFSYSYKNEPRMYLTGSKVTDASLSWLANPKEMTSHLPRYLDLSGSSISDAGLLNLKGLTKLQCLNLIGTNISNAGLAELEGLSQLPSLFLEGTKVTAAGVADIQKALPNCTIIR